MDEDEIRSFICFLKSLWGFVTFLLWGVVGLVFFRGTYCWFALQMVRERKLKGGRSVGNTHDGYGWYAVVFGSF